MGTRILILTLLLTILVGCSKSKYYYTFSAPKKKMCKGFVIGIINDNPKFFGWGRMLTNILEVDLLNAGYEIKDFSLARNFFTTEEKMIYFYRPQDVYSKEFLERIGGLLNTDWIMGGRILKIVQRGDYVEVEVMFWIRSAKTGKLLWLAYYKKDSNSYRSIFHFGKITNIGKLFDVMIKKDVIKDIKKVIKCSEKVSSKK